MAVLYLKYRPKTFSQLDNVEARESLIKLFSGKSVPHALLFTGSKGIGKTSAARIVAKALNCENNNITQGIYEPCNECSSCLSVENDSSIDIFEIDAASNRGIDDIRDLREKVKLSPSGSRYKVYIIDEVHMLTNESFNALLKTLEQPPKHAFFILCTTDYEKIPKTIVSRCTRIHFKKATITEITNKLESVARGEDIEVDDNSLKLLAKYSDASFRDAIKLLEQASSMGKVTDETVMMVAGLNKEFPVEQLLGFLEKREISGALDWLAKANEANLNFKLVIQELVEQLRLLMLKSFGLVNDPNGTEYVFSLDEIKVLIRLLQQANMEMRQAVVASLPLEMAVIDYLSTGNKEAPKMGKAELTSLPPTKEGRIDDIPTASAEPRGVEKKTVVSPANNTNLEGSWPKILEEVKPLNHSVLAFLRASRPLSLDESGNLTIEVFYKFHKDQLETDRCRKIFEQAAGQVLATDIKLRCTLGEGKPKAVTSEEPIYEVRLDASPASLN